jgi:hypothetical protein
MGADRRWRAEAESDTEWVAGFCEFELGHGDVYLPVASRECAE